MAKYDKVKISVEDLENIELPEGYKLIKMKDPKEEKLKEIERLEMNLAMMTEPSDQDLIEEGKMTHPFFELKRRIEWMKIKGNK